MVDSNLVSIKNSVEMVTLSSQSHVKTLVHGIPTSTIISSELPMTPTNIFTCRLFVDGGDDYLVISSTLDSKTLVLLIGDAVEEVTDSQFVTDQPTIDVRQVGACSVVQVYSNGIRHIKHKRESSEIERVVTDWFPPAGITILLASTNHEQVIIGMSNSEICYFEIDEDDQLIEYQERIEVQGSIKAISLVSDAETKSYFAVVGTSDETIQVLSLQPHNCLETLSLQALSANCTSLAMVAYKNFTLVHIGMANGLYVRSKIDEITGNLSDTKIKYVGSLPVMLSTMKIPNGNTVVMVLSTSTWLSYMNQDEEIKVSPLLDMNVSDCASFAYEEINGQASVGLSGNNLVIFSIGTTASNEFTGHDDFGIRNMKLRYNPKKMIVDSSKSSTIIYTLQSQYNTKGLYKPTDLTQSIISENTGETNPSNPIVEKGSWASCIQVLDYENQDIIQSIELPLLDSPISMNKLKFSTTKNNTEHLIVGITKNFKFIPNTYDSNYLLTFKITRGKKLEFVHKTEVDFQPTCMVSFNGKLLVGMSNYLRLYDLGQKQLLRKLSTQIAYLNRFMRVLHQGGERIVVGDSNNSITFLRFDTIENKFFPMADDTMKRQITSLATLDYDSVVGGDKFGNVFVARLPKAVSKQSDEDWGLTKNQEPHLNGAGSRLTSVCEFYSYDIPISISKGSLGFAGSQECIIVTGLQGTISLFLPLITKQEVELLVNLELAMREEFDFNFDRSKKKKHDNLLGKDHIKFRSYYNPVKNVIDGDLIEKFYELNQAGKIRVSSKVDRTPSEVDKKISDLRERSAF
jgi:splicing factor 3B subunit 3